MNHPCKLFLATMLAGIVFTLSFPTKAQHISLQFDRVVSADTSAQNGLGDSFETGGQTIEDNATNGVFNYSYDQHASISHETIRGQVVQTTLITNTDNTITISGTMSTLDASTGIADTNATGIGGTTVQGILSCVFEIDQPMNFTLTTSILYAYAGDTNPEEIHDAYVGFGPTDGSTNNTFVFGNPNTRSYDQATNPYSGTNSGTLPPGGYSLQVSVFGDAAWNFDPYNSVGSYSYATSNSITFSFTGTIAAPAAPPTIQGLTPLIPGLFQLNWTAPQAGTYRVLASSNLVDWAESVSAASYNAGANTTEVDAVTAGQGYYRLEYMAQ